MNIILKQTNLFIKKLTIKLKRWSIIGLNYKKINPFKVNWYDIDTVHFPFYIRQSTGCDNSLGIIKLDFEAKIIDTLTKNEKKMKKRPKIDK